MAWTWCIQSEGRVPVPDQAAHLRELRDGYGPVEAADLLQVAKRAIAWATADRALIEQHEQLLFAALR
jgi:hypothetical protein